MLSENIEWENPLIPKELISFVSMVLDLENLNDWKVIIWDIEAGEIVWDMKLIYFDYRYNDINVSKGIFLHEVAHAIDETYPKPNIHDETFQKVYANLLEKYTMFFPNLFSWTYI